MGNFTTKFIDGGLNGENPQKKIRKSNGSHKKQHQNVKSTGDWCKRELVWALIRASQLRTFSYDTIYKDYSGKKVPSTTLFKRLNEMAKEMKYDSFSLMMKNASDNEIFYVCNEANVDKMKCSEVRTRGVKTYLSEEQELVLATMMNYMSIDGAGIDFEILKLWLHELIIEFWHVDYFNNGEVSRGWYNGFRARHPFIKSRVGRTLEDVRHVAEASIAPFFRAITARMIGVDPRLVGNLDESMCSAVDKHIRIIGCALSKVARRKGMESQKPHISILPIVTAAGEFLTALIVEGSANKNRIPHVPSNYNQSENQKFHYGATASGFIEMDLFELFMMNTVVRAINKMREREGLTGQKFFLFLDGHASHHSMKVTDFLLDQNIIVMFFPPHTSHILQPLDRGVFHSLKRATAKALFRNNTLCGTSPNIGTRV